MVAGKAHENGKGKGNRTRSAYKASRSSEMRDRLKRISTQGIHDRHDVHVTIKVWVCISIIFLYIAMFSSLT